MVASRSGMLASKGTINKLFPILIKRNFIAVIFRYSQVKSYDLFLDISTESLLKINDVSKNTIQKLEVEIIEDDLYVANILYPEFGANSSLIPVGEPLAVLCENESEISLFDKITVSKIIFFFNEESNFSI